MGLRIINPMPATASKISPGISDVSCVNGVYKFMGCSVISVNMTLGFNGTPSSLTVNLVEDTDNDDSFIEPTIPSLWGFSLPKGGIGKSIFVESPTLQPDSFSSRNVPFYFCGYCSNWSRSMLDVSGKTISVTLTDPREMLSGTQCLLGGFALSQSLTGGSRYTRIFNVIDIYGYYAYGMESNKNEYGMEWSKIKEALERVRFAVNDIQFEVVFTGDTFTGVPSFYRIEDNILDIGGLCQKVASDSGSDFMYITRKVGENLGIVEIRGMRRRATDLLTKQEINDFIEERGDIVISARVGKEYRNEPTSNIIVGGFKNSMYIALPSEYNINMHLVQDPSGVAIPTQNNKKYREDYNLFPADIKTRLFGGEAEIFSDRDNEDDSSLQSNKQNFSVRSGAIYPFWGFAPRDSYHPLMEPFLCLEHLVFDKNSELYGKLLEKVPLCLINIANFSVRNVEHDDVFLTDDGDADDRPFAYLDSYVLSNAALPNHVRGLPLNTEVLRAAIISSEAFYETYRFYYPDISERMSFPRFNWDSLNDYVDSLLNNGNTPDLLSINVITYLSEARPPIDNDQIQPLDRSTGRLDKEIVDALRGLRAEQAVDRLETFREVIYQLVKQYALDYMGRRFFVCLPKSNIMQRIWNNLPVPTRTGKPEIEYVVDERGFWENLPTDFDGLVPQTGNDDADDAETEKELEIRNRFMAEDGRFYAMVAIDWKPKGNINFNSNELNKAMFQDLPVSEFRPNKIAAGNPNYVMVSCNVSQMVRRPDLALVELPCAIQFDPTDAFDIFDPRFHDNPDLSQEDDEGLTKKFGIVKYLWYQLKKNNTARDVINKCAVANNENFHKYASEVFSRWKEQIYNFCRDPFTYSASTEFIMDLKAVVIPLTSTWVSYGPWYARDYQAKGMTKIQVDPSLVPWNFIDPGLTNPSGSNRDYWRILLDRAGTDALNQTICDIDYLDNASISTAGFPEYGIGDQLGYNSNLTGISVDFGTGGIKTTYNFATYSNKPGTFRKNEYDNVSRARIDTREKIPDPSNISISNMITIGAGTNRFKD
jgi:hypothetical protein